MILARVYKTDATCNPWRVSVNGGTLRDAAGYSELAFETCEEAVRAMRRELALRELATVPSAC